jgi:dihydrofolate synthase/folylpolyglutamate synthase
MRQPSKRGQAQHQVGELLSRFKRLHPKSIELALDRVQRLLAALGHPERALPPVIHVAGTNGKGSVVAYLKAICEAAGLRPHAFISPHLRRFNERIVLAGGKGAPAAPVADGPLADALLRVDQANQGEPITFFEITTAAAFLAFAENPADVLLLETGLGGRLDATNVVDNPALTIITPVSMDHTGFLGDTLTAIAAEKAGVLKRGAPCIVSPQSEAALETILKRASHVGAPVLAAGQDWDAFEQHGRLVFQDEHGLLDLPLPRLPGPHQIDNAGTAVAAARELEALGVGGEHIARGLTSAQWRARLERLGPGALYEHTIPGSELWLDGGHNPAAGEALARAMADFEERASSPLHIICGMMCTKDAAGFLGPFQGLAEFVGTLAIPGQPNAYAPDELAAAARRCGLYAEPASGLREAFALSRAVAERPVRILIAGSLYLAGHVLETHEFGLM